MTTDEENHMLSEMMRKLKESYSVFRKNPVPMAVSWISDLVMILLTALISMAIIDEIQKHINQIIPIMVPYLSNAGQQMMSIADLAAVKSHMHSIAGLVILLVLSAYVIWAVCQSVSWLCAFHACRVPINRTSYIGYVFAISAMWYLVFGAMGYALYKAVTVLLGIGAGGVSALGFTLIGIVFLALGYFMTISYAGTRITSGLAFAWEHIRDFGLIYIGAVLCLGITGIIAVILGMMNPWLMILIFLLVMLPYLFYARIVYVEYCRMFMQRPMKSGLQAKGGKTRGAAKARQSPKED